MAAMILAFLIALAVANADCPTGCNTCEGTTCTSCLNTFYLTAGTCQACTSCPQGTYQSEACGAVADTQCLACSGACPSGQYQDTACTATADRHCTACSGACPSGKYQDAACTATADRHCADCTANCNICAGPTICQECNSGYFRIPGAGCQACNAASCPSQYYYNSDLCLPNSYSSGCTPCGAGCQACSAVSGIVTCTSCGDGSQGWYLSGGSCAACSTSACPDGSWASACSSNADRTCIACSATMPYCATCSGATTCTSCASGYYVSGDGTGCTACSSAMPYCATCSGANTCTSCASSYYVSSDGAGCTGCFSTNCNTCTAGNYASCTSCVQGMYLNDAEGNCTACGTQTCQSGQYYNAANCLPNSKSNGCTACRRTCGGLTPKLWGVCTSSSNTECKSCSDAVNQACAPTAAAWWPSNRVTCCESRSLSASLCNQYQYVLTCTGLVQFP